MRPEDIDRILAGDEEIVPSSGFASVVMAAVKRESGAPPPIPFPWVRAVPGIAVAVLAMALALLGTLSGSPARPDIGVVSGAVIEAAGRSGAGWILLSLSLTLLSVAMARRLTSAVR